MKGKKVGNGKKNCFKFFIHAKVKNREREKRAREFVRIFLIIFYFFYLIPETLIDQLK